MKKVLIFILAITLIITATDIAIGTSCKYFIRSHELVGRYKPLDRLLKSVQSDIVIIGNSVVLDAIDPQIISDSLSLSCYNGGITGKSIEFSEILIESILQRYTPRMLVIGLRPEEMGEKAGDGIFDVLKPYYHLGYKSIDDYFEQSSQTDRLLLQSNLLRYNTIWMRVLLYMAFDRHEYPANGFMPQEVPAVLPQLKTVDIYDQPLQRKVESLRRIIKTCKARNIDLHIIFPPALLSYSKKELPCVSVVRQLCAENGIDCSVDYDARYFVERPGLFYDNYHMNKKGAEAYTKYVAGRLKALYQS